MKNIFTIDTEDWFHANYEEGLFDNGSENVSTVEKNVEDYLNLFQKYNIKATFFILGFVAEKHPNIVKKIHSHGHEIASHGYAHKLVYNQTPNEFREDIKKSKNLIESIIGEKVLGYRAPSWSITKKSLWALEILEQEGYKYDSSIFPFENFLYGIKEAPRYTHKASQYNGGSDIIEIPPSTISIFGKYNIPFSGGFYFRFMPVCCINKFTKIINKDRQPVIFYLHPREIDKEQPKLKLSKRDSFIHYYGVGSCRKKLEKTLKTNEFRTMKDLYMEFKR